jgi:excisionase family DNA binding protein
MSFLTVTQIAKRLAVSNRTVLNLIDRGRFPNAYKIDPMAKRITWRIPIKDVETFELQQKGLEKETVSN